MDPDSTTNSLPSCLPIPDEHGETGAYLIPVTLTSAARPETLIRVGQQYYVVGHVFYL